MTTTAPVQSCPGLTASLSRRTLLRGLGIAGGAALASALVPAHVAFADPGSPATDTLVVLFLRGAADWLSILPPVGDPAYAAARPTIAVPASRALPLDAMFGLHPAMGPLLPFWQSGAMGFVHAVGSPDPTRSHFEAQTAIELGAFDGRGMSSGWLDRYLVAVGGGGGLQAVQRGQTLPLSLGGPAPAVALGSLQSFSITGAPGAGYPAAMAGMYAGITHPLAAQAADTFGALGAVKAITASSYAPANGAVYPTGGTGPALQDLARLIKAGVGLRLATLDVGNWDMHQGLGAHGAVDGGWMQGNLVDLAGSLAAFATDLGTAMAGVTVVTVPDFGRRGGENGSGGVDHGHGQAMLLLGGGTRGGKVHGSWPSLAPAALDRGDLAGTTDIRSVFGELLADRMGLTDAGVRAVFPGWTPAYLDHTAPRPG